MRGGEAIDDDAKGETKGVPYGAAQFGSDDSSAGPSHAARQLLGPSGQPRRAIGSAGFGSEPLLTMTDVATLVFCAAGASSPVGDVNRTVNESPYKSAVATALRRGAMARRFQSIVRLRK
jgi:hypothetical protein